MAVNPDTAAPIVRSLIPARLDRLPWTRFHTRLIMALGAAWIPRGRRPAPVRGRPAAQGLLLPQHAAFRDRCIGRRMNGNAPAWAGPVMVVSH